eukprot:CAMPEP_0183712556 /NCGR_PEP_ID=MMETSP0737-20130205/7649_1 /TAXON_ID=385413 /ORGANISM="Thalassiosira miniscula, Strain CCMP1093" /LENGTH=507 /DNA_ID=CAMNT_0025941191 /DNA_START=145 /DNA_END=1668 /DNA_ORIENTATION=+
MNLRWGAAAAAIAAAAGLPGTCAFTSTKTSSLVTSKPSTSPLFMGPPTDASAPLTEQFGEGSRKYRRTVYTHNEWVNHRSSDRFFNNLRTLPSSGIYKNIGNEVAATVSVATAICVWNALVGGYADLSSVMHDPILQADWALKVGLPMEAFTLISPSLGLLLAFRTNQSYKRWDEARKFWGLNINHTRDLNRMATAWYGNQNDFDSTEFFEPSTAKLGPIDEKEREELLGQVSLMTWAFVRSMKRHLSPIAEDEEDFVAEVKAKLSPEQAEALISANHRPNRALYDLSVAIEKLPMHFVRKNAINNNLSIFEDTLGGSERLLSSPVPLFYSRHTARFISTWLLFLPMGLYAPFANSWNHSMMIPATAFVAIFLYGIEELATQLEEPFTILPMQGFCDKIGMNCDEIVSWAGQGQPEPIDTSVKVASGYDFVSKSVAKNTEVVATPPKPTFSSSDTRSVQIRNAQAASSPGRIGRLKNRIKRRFGLKKRMAVAEFQPTQAQKEFFNKN